MFTLSDSLSYYYFRESTDMRKVFDALCGMVRTQMQRNPLSAEVFIFMNRPRNTVKILRWESGGLVIYHKRLEQGCFEEPVYSNNDITTKVHAHNTYYKRYFYQNNVRVQQYKR